MYQLEIDCVGGKTAKRLLQHADKRIAPFIDPYWLNLFHIARENTSQTEIHQEMTDLDLLESLKLMKPDERL